MSKTVVYIGVAVVAIAGLVVGVQVLNQPIIGIAIAVVALLIGIFLLRRTDEESEEFFEAPDDDYDEPVASTGTATAEPLAAWEPEGLTPWTPPETDDTDGGDVLVAEAEEAPFDTTTFEPSFESDLAEADLEDLERIDEFVGSESEEFGSFTTEEGEEDEEDAFLAPIDEDVHSDDEILAASHATELHVEATSGNANSELAKLLAKVQDRLAAYE